MPRRRPSKFSDDMQERMKSLYALGLTDKQVCHAVGIDESTLTKWKQSKPAFFMSINDWKAEADREVEKSLYQRACGYDCPETKAQWVNDENGGRWEYAEMRKHYPPDPTSMIFWLKNRQPKQWRDKVDVKHAIELPSMNVYRDPPPTPEGDENGQDPGGEPTD